MSTDHSTISMTRTMNLMLMLRRILTESGLQGTMLQVKLLTSLVIRTRMMGTVTALTLQGLHSELETLRKCTWVLPRVQD